MALFLQDDLGLYSMKKEFFPKGLVEDCLAIDSLIFAKIWRKMMREKHLYHFVYIFPNRERGWVEMFLWDDVGTCRVYLRCRKPELIQDFELVPVTPYLGGKHWYFICPKCKRRVRKLYLPDGENEFLCRKCHNLTYSSSQTHNRNVDALLRKHTLSELYWMFLKNLNLYSACRHLSNGRVREFEKGVFLYGNAICEYIITMRRGGKKWRTTAEYRITKERENEED